MRAKHLSIMIALILSLLLVSAPQALAQATRLEIEVTQQSHLIFDGDRLPINVTLSNVSDSSLQEVIVRASTSEQRAVGTLGVAVEEQVTLFLETYSLGNNQVEIYATYSGGETAHKSIWFEVRPPRESVTLRIVNAPQSTYGGTVYTAQFQVQNLWQQGVSGVRIKNGGEVLYYVGALEPNQSQDITLRVEKYNIGLNRLELVAEHERGTAPAVPLEFEVVPANSAVKVYLASLSQATYTSETLQLTLVVAASEQAGISELEVKALSKGIQPTGYYIGEQIAEEQEVPTVDIQSLLTGGTAEEEKQPDTSVRGRELTFEVKDPWIGTEPLSFQVSYRLGSAVIQKEFTVDATVVEAPSVRLIQAARIVATKGEEALIRLHVANDLPVEVDAVRVVPLGNLETSPSEFFIGTMSPNDFLPANFKVETGNLRDGDQLSFKAVYRVGRQTYETPPLNAVVHLEASTRTNPAIYIVPPVVVVLLVLLWWSLRRKRWTQSRS